MNGPLYRLHQVTKQYDGRRVVQVEALDLWPGEILGLIGPSGAGKSTLLRLLNFLEPPSNGRIEFLGVPFKADRPMPLSLRRRVTMVFQRPLLLNRSVRANIAYGLRLRGRTDRTLVEQALEEVGLTDLARRPARSLSGGEAQRVALARAMVLRPDVLLLDEPTANLDPYNVELIESILRRMNQDQGTAMVLVTHNIFQARRLAHRVALMLNGHIVETTAVEQFFLAPSDPRTAAFVAGEMVY